MTNLTDREEQILILIEQGFEIKQIADILSCSLITIKFHRSNILIKLEAHNMPQAVANHIKTYTKV